MRLSVLVGACAILLGTVAAASSVEAQAAQKFAFINSQALVAAAPGRVEADAQFEKEMESLRTQAQQMTDSLRTMEEALRKDEPGLSPAARETRVKALRDKEAEFEDRLQKLQEQAQSRQAELMQPVMDNVRKVLDDVRAEGGYAFIFDAAAGNFIVAADKNLDITDRVVAKLRLSAPKPAAKPPTGPAAAPAGVQTRRPPSR